MSEENKPKPETKTKIGQFEITSWKNTSGEGDKKKEWLSYQLQKSYKDKEDKWQNQKITLNTSDLPKVALALNKAFEKHYDKNPESE